MTKQEYTNIRVPVDAWEDASDAKLDSETWADYLRRCADEPPAELTPADVEALVDDRLEEHGLI